MFCKSLHIQNMCAWSLQNLNHLLQKVCKTLRKCAKSVHESSWSTEKVCKKSAKSVLFIKKVCKKSAKSSPDADSADSCRFLKKSARVCPPMAAGAGAGGFHLFHGRRHHMAGRASGVRQGACGNAAATGVFRKGQESTRNRERKLSRKTNESGLSIRILLLLSSKYRCFYTCKAYRKIIEALKGPWLTAWEKCYFLSCMHAYLEHGSPNQNLC